VAPHLEIDDSAQALAADIVSRLDCLPLAIELAAARAGLGLAAVRDLLDHPLALRARNHDLPPRHASLRTAIEGSWRLLDEAEQACLAQSSAFAGGFSLAAAERVIAPPEGAAPVAELLESLRDKSMVRAEPDEEVAGEVRFRLLDAIRAFAAEILAEIDPAGTARDRHAAYFAQAAAA
jgi:predicted ATPase